MKHTVCKTSHEAAALLRVLILLSTGYATVMMLHWPIGFTFFTQLSNLFVAAVVLAQLLTRDRVPALRLWKYAATVSITLTFLVYLLALAPMVPGGIVSAYAQDHCASFCLHLVTPLLTLADFLLHDRDFPWKKRHVLLSALPPFAWLLMILLLGRLGLRWGPGGVMAAPYPFLNYAAPAGWFGFLPETAGYTTMGIGVFYAIGLLIPLVLLLGALLLKAVCGLRPVNREK